MVVLAIVISAVLGLANSGVAVVGSIPSGLPSLDVPDFQFSDVLTLLPAAVGIFFVAFTSEILIARSAAGNHGQRVHANTELAAMGAINLSAGISQGFPIGASGSRTAVNDQMGARTQISGLLAAVVIALVLLFLTGPIQYLPQAALGAVIVTAAIGMIDPGAWRGLARVSRVEVAIAAVTMAGVITVGVLRALATGCRALCRRRGAPQRDSARRSTRLGGATGPARRRQAAPDGHNRSGSAHLPAR